MTDHRYFLREAYKIAQQSLDPSTQNGAVLVDPAHATILARGANNFPRDVQTQPERWERPAKYSWVEHAERNAIYDAALIGVPTKGLVMYCCWAACTDCARAIIQSGIKEVVTHYDPTSSTRFEMPAAPSWLESIKIAMKMFDEAAIKITPIEGPLFLLDEEFEIRFNGKLVKP